MLVAGKYSLPPLYSWCLIGQLLPDLSVSFIIAFHSTTLSLKDGFCCLLLQETSHKKIVTNPCFLAE
jgi:hypothetical protein